MKHTEKCTLYTRMMPLMPIVTVLIFCYQKINPFVFITDKKTVEISIFVHGVCNIEGHINNLPAVINFFKDDIYNTYYQHNLKLFRKERSFYQFQAMQDLGLHEITDFSITQGNSCGAVASVIQQTFSLICPKKQVQQRYYTYGWSGLHSVKEYCAVGNHFYHEIITLKRELLKQGYNPIIKVWGYSHGGNVALMMAHHYRSNTKHLIDELILLGTPFITNATVELVASPLFKKVYNVYSLSDKVQQYDLIHLNAFLCEQKLTIKSINPLPQNLIQVRLKYTRASKHAQRTKKSFAHSQNFTKNSIITGRSSLLRNMSPGHLELWLFGWTFDHYRPHFITYPIPAGAISIPYALHYLDALVEESRHNPVEEFIIDVRPDHEVVLINQKTKKNGTINKLIAPFFTTQDFALLKENVTRYAPANLTYESYCEKLAQIDKEALATRNN